MKNDFNFFLKNLKNFNLLLINYITIALEYPFKNFYEIKYLILTNY